MKLYPLRNNRNRPTHKMAPKNQLWPKSQKQGLPLKAQKRVLPLLPQKKRKHRQPTHLLLNRWQESLRKRTSSCNPRKQMLQEAMPPRMRPLSSEMMKKAGRYKEADLGPRERKRPRIKRIRKRKLKLKTAKSKGNLIHPDLARLPSIFPTARELWEINFNITYG